MTVVMSLCCGTQDGRDAPLRVPRRGRRHRKLELRSPTLRLRAGAGVAACFGSIDREPLESDGSVEVQRQVRARRTAIVASLRHAKPNAFPHALFSDRVDSGVGLCLAGPSLYPELSMIILFLR